MQSPKTSQPSSLRHIITAPLTQPPPKKRCRLTYRVAAGQTHSTSFVSSLRNALQLKQPNVKAHERYRLFLDNWDKGFMEAVEDAEGYWVDVVFGAIPKELQGTLFRNGPGRFSVGDEKIAHPYDGDGLVASIAFKDGAAYFRSRFVRTAEFKAEESSNEVLFRGTFATQRRGGASANALDLHVKNSSNTNVVCHAGKVWSLFEAGQPYCIDPHTLETQGIETLGGFLAPGLPLNLGSTDSNTMLGKLTRLAQSWSGTTSTPTTNGTTGTTSSSSSHSRQLPQELLNAGGDAVTAHPHLDPATGRLVAFSYSVRPIPPTGPGSPIVGTDIRFWELDDKGEVVVTKEFFIAGFAFVHDFAMTENYYIIFQNPVTVDNVPYLLGTAPAASCVRWVAGTPTLVHLIPRPKLSSEEPSPAGGAGEHGNSSTHSGREIKPHTFVAPPLFVFHHANAYESDNGARITIDSIHYNSLPAVGREALAEQKLDPDAAFSSRLRRLDIDLDTHVMRLRCAFDGYMEMPAINPNTFGRQHRYVYGYHSLFADPQIALVKVDMDANVAETWAPGPQRFALEPRFVPRPGATREDDGWLVAQVFDAAAGCSEIVILDASALAQGPVAVLRLKEALPSALHACWSEVYYGPEGGAPEPSVNVVPFGLNKNGAKGGSENDAELRA